MIERNVIRSGVFFVGSYGLALLVLFSGSDICRPAKAEEWTRPLPVSPPESVLFRRTLDTGFLFVDGQFVTGPYVIEASVEQLVVNGIPCIEVSGDVPTVPRRRRNRRSREDEHNDEYDEENDGGDGPRERTPERTAELFEETLTDDGIVVVFRGATPTQFSSGSKVAEFCTALLSENPADNQANEFVRLPADRSQTDLWRSWLSGFQPTSELRERLQARLDHIESVEEAGLSRTAALRRLETFTYPLTLAGMLLGVFALGHILKWTTREIAFEKDDSYLAELKRCVEVGLLLMLGMSAIDLVWTILAGQAGVMREINPVAATMIQSSVQLAVFKCVATGLGIGILFALRHRRQIQNATWWMCLVCVLLTFRWVVFDSVMS